MARWTKVRLKVTSAGHAGIHWPYDPRFNQHYGVTHGAIVGFLADSAGFFACASTLPEGVVTTVQFSVHLLRPAHRQALDVEARCIKSGKRILTSEMKVYDQKGRLLGAGTGTYVPYDPEKDLKNAKI